MNSIEEIKNFIESIDVEQPIFKIKKSYYPSYMSIMPQAWKARDALVNSDNHWESFIGMNISRRYNSDTKAFEIKDNRFITEKLPEYIKNTIIDMANETSLSNQPKRTNAYKEIVEIANANKREESFMNEMIPIINYYYSMKTESKKNNMSMDVHKSNVRALFDISRKKYGRPSK